jgi:hypothetical protein
MLKILETIHARPEQDLDLNSDSKKNIYDPQHMTLEYGLLVHRNLLECRWGHFKYYWRVLNVILKGSPINIIFPVCFQQVIRGSSGKLKKYPFSSKYLSYHE